MKPKIYLTLDGGTSTTRLSLVRDGEIMGRISRPVGSGARDGGKADLHGAIRDCIGELLTANRISEADVETVIASGMITSEYGLLDLPHVKAPAGPKELHDAMYKTSFPDITPIPFTFIRGVLWNNGSLSETDMMRGEETELFGIREDARTGGLVILPGSHSKLIVCDGEKKIRSFTTMLSGEMVYALAKSTILAGSVDLSLDGFDLPSLLHGYRYAVTHGLNEALFKTRILKNKFSASPIVCYSFFLGAVLSSEIRAILKKGAQQITVSGRHQLSAATGALLSALSDVEVNVLSERETAESTVRGAIAIYEYSD